MTDSNLSPRELQVASLIAEDLSNKQIAARLGIVESTVKTTTFWIAKKWNCRSRTGIAVKYTKESMAKTELLKLVEKVLETERQKYDL